MSHVPIAQVLECFSPAAHSTGIHGKYNIALLSQILVPRPSPAIPDNLSAGHTITIHNDGIFFCFGIIWRECDNPIEDLRFISGWKMNYLRCGPFIFFKLQKICLAQHMYNFPGFQIPIKDLFRNSQT